MIFLIDDSDLGRLDAEYVLDHAYKDILCVIRDECGFEEKFPLMSQAECIMMHVSFCQSRNFKDRVAQITEKGSTIPFVCFSAGDRDEAEFAINRPNRIARINKVVFYRRLRFFLRSYIEKGEMNLLLLAYGENYMGTITQGWVMEIMKRTIGLSGRISQMDLAGIASDGSFKKLLDASAPAIGMSYGEIIKDLVSDPMTVAEFQHKIAKIGNSFYEHGKNIYSWK